ncbi:hypothetical protein MK489_01775 [Myxococcota bacterium]|nr:hypothetical protein [Myxococcota bacterium]
MTGENGVLVVSLLLPVGFGVALVVFFRSREAGGSDRRGLLLGNALVLGLLLSLCLAGGELYFRFVYDTTESFGFSKVGRRWYERYFHKNAAGYRDGIDYPMAVRPGTRRISFLGDSFTTGQGLPDIAERFVNRVRAARPEWEVHAIADNGWNTGVEIEEIETITEQGYELDRVVLVYCLNDGADLVPDWQRTVRSLVVDRRESWWVANSYLINTLYYRLMASRDPRVAGYYTKMLDGYEAAVWQAQLRRLEGLARDVRKRGGELEVVTFPFLNLMGEDPYPFSEVHDQLDELWGRLNVRHLDLRDLYAGLDPDELVVNPFDAHPNAHAHELAAGAILRFLDNPGG